MVCVCLNFFFFAASKTYHCPCAYSFPSRINLKSRFALVYVMFNCWPRWAMRKIKNRSLLSSLGGWLCSQSQYVMRYIYIYIDIDVRLNDVCARMDYYWSHSTSVHLTLTKIHYQVYRLVSILQCHLHWISYGFVHAIQLTYNYAVCYSITWNVRMCRHILKSQQTDIRAPPAIYFYSVFLFLLFFDWHFCFFSC